MLTILTFFSTPILEKIFGNGALEVGDHSYETSITEKVSGGGKLAVGNDHSYKTFYRFQGEDPDDWDAMEVLPRTNPDPAEDEVSSNFQKQALPIFLGGWRGDEQL